MKIKRTNNRLVWMNRKIIRASRHKLHLYNSYKLNKNPADLVLYKKAVKSVKNMVKNAKKVFERKLVKKSSDKLFNSYVKNKTSVKSGIGPLKDSRGSTCKEDNEMADILIVVINGKSSGWIDVESGVPQGSILGPILFVIFINDIDNQITNLTNIIRKFADDTKLGHKVNNEADSRVLQLCLDILFQWTVSGADTGIK